MRFIRGVCAPPVPQLGFAELARLFHYAFGLLGKLLASFLGTTFRSSGAHVLSQGQAGNGSGRQITLPSYKPYLRSFWDVFYNLHILCLTLYKFVLIS